MKACPFCKRKPDRVHEFGVLIGNNFQVVCNCGAHGPVAAFQERAIDAWENRPEESAPAPGTAIDTAEAFMETLFALGEAISRIRLGRLPESTAASNAATMAETLYYQIKRQEMCAPDNPFAPVFPDAPTAEEIESETWGGGQ